MLLNQKESSSLPKYFILTIMLLLLIGRMFYFAKKPPSIFNYSFYIIISSSMEPQYPLNSIVIVKKVPFEKLKKDDVIVFKSDALNGRLAFHRITRLEENGVFVKGDKNSHEDNQLITENEYVGKGIKKLSAVGQYLVAVSTFKGFILFFISPILIFVLIKETIKRMLN